MASRLVLIDTGVERALNALRKLRNAFAHSTESAYLADPVHRSRIMEVLAGTRQPAMGTTGKRFGSPAANRPWLLGSSPARLHPADHHLGSIPSGHRPGSQAIPVTSTDEQEELVALAVSHLDGLLSFLMKAARNSWELPTSQVQLLVGAKPRGTTFSRYGFSFRPAGKHGQETSWRVGR